ncbi:hypothetical protein DL93DRAFT_2077923 [Clavulina sp. PMI_390]|nr:hypothetical protein DL93DRAFT_2077923 [Clavulina sp. PMI_390]
MRPSPLRLVQILPRHVVAKTSNVVARPHVAPAAAAPSLIAELAERQKLAGASWPSNLRIEQFEDEKADWKGYTDGVRTELREFVREK